jgi:hypothetical protein
MTDSDGCKSGHAIFEEFKTVIILKEQKRVTDPVWHQMLTNLRKGEMQSDNIQMLHGLIICRSPNDEFDTEPCSNAFVVTSPFL